MTKETNVTKLLLKYTLYHAVANHPSLVESLKLKWKYGLKLNTSVTNLTLHSKINFWCYVNKSNFSLNYFILVAISTPIFNFFTDSHTSQKTSCLQLLLVIIQILLQQTQCWDNCLNPQQLFSFNHHLQPHHVLKGLLRFFQLLYHIPLHRHCHRNFQIHLLCRLLVLCRGNFLPSSIKHCNDLRITNAPSWKTIDPSTHDVPAASSTQILSGWAGSVTKKDVHTVVYKQSF